MEQELLKQFYLGDENAFSLLYSKHAKGALLTAASILGSANDAEDCVQEAFCRAYMYRAQYNSAYPFEAWFYKILLNICRRKRYKLVNKSINEADEEALQYLAAQDTGARYTELYEAIQSLSHRHRECIVLKYLCGFSEKDIAQILKTNQNTVKSRLFKSRAALRKKLGEEDLQ
ncbi:MAG: RNA polymerase sigma factor [Oscillospiraceae bacterium]|nr:RNA polymerase sigma factor [Oscillospiraceae bacterium]